MVIRNIQKLKLQSGQGNAAICMNTNYNVGIGGINGSTNADVKLLVNGYTIKSTKRYNISGNGTKVC
jgi:hypothetical protein